MIIFPAIDLKDGQVVRLTQGDYGRMDVYDQDPVAVAVRFKGAGATHLHVVDLDGAKDGTPKNREALKALAQASGLFIQTGGGMRSPAHVESALAFGVNRVILGTAALRDSTFLTAMLAAYGNRIAVGVDARDGKVAVSGWLENTGRDAIDFCRELLALGVSTIIYTDISRDGAFTGPNLSAYRTLAALSGLQVIASGGVGGETDVTALRDIGVHGVIIGKALYTGRVELGRAIAIGEGGKNP